jgi:hypothetical protein
LLESAAYSHEEDHRRTAAAWRSADRHSVQVNFAEAVDRRSIDRRPSGRALWTGSPSLSQARRQRPVLGPEEGLPRGRLA